MSYSIAPWCLYSQKCYLQALRLGAFLSVMLMVMFTGLGCTTTPSPSHLDDGHPRKLVWESLAGFDALGPRAMSQCFANKRSLIIVGGIRDDVELNPFTYTGASYSLVNQSWVPLQLPEPLKALSGPKSALYKDTLITFGGKSELGDFPSQMTVYDLIDKQYEILEAPITSGRHRHSVTVGGDHVYIFGGAGSEQGLDMLVVNLNEKTVATVELPSKIKNRVAHVAESDGEYFFVWGGFADDHKSDSGALYHHQSKTWEFVDSISFLEPRSNARSVVVDSKVYIWGGSTASGNANSGAVFDLQTKKWSPMNAIPDQTYKSIKNPSFTALDGKHILLWGGRYGSGEFTNRAWLYDIDRDRWSELDQDHTPLPRMLHCGAIGGGAFYLFGGITVDDGRFTHLGYLNRLNIIDSIQL